VYRWDVQVVGATPATLSLSNAAPGLRRQCGTQRRRWHRGGRRRP